MFIFQKGFHLERYIVEQSFFTSWTIRVKNAHGPTCKKTNAYIYLYIHLSR